MQVLDNATTDGNALGDVEYQVSAVSKMAGDEWKKLSDQAKEPYQKEYEAAKGQCDRDLAIFPCERRHKGEGHRSKKETLQLKESKKAS